MSVQTVDAAPQNEREAAKAIAREVTEALTVVAADNAALIDTIRTAMVRLVEIVEQDA